MGRVVSDLAFLGCELKILEFAFPFFCIVVFNLTIFLLASQYINKGNGYKIRNFEFKESNFFVNGYCFP